MTEKIQISSKSFNSKNPEVLKLLKNSNLEIADELTPDAEVIGIIAGTEKINKEVIDKYPNLKVVSRYGAGIDNLDIDALNEKEISWCNTPEAPSKAVAEFTVMTILRLLRMDEESLHNKTVGIMGTGNIGSKVDEMLKGFGCGVITFDTKVNAWGIYDKLIAESDVITIHVPLNANSYHMIDWCSIDAMEKRPYIINTSRGEIVDEDAVKWALDNGKIRGFASDVNEEFDGYGNVIITLHIASKTRECRNQMEIESVRNLINEIKGNYI